MVEYKKTVKRVGLITITLNALLSISKVVSGVFASSSSLISDGIHSLSDILSTIVVMIGAKMAAKDADKEHPFGHERMEYVATLILALLLVFTAAFLGYNAVTSLISYINGTKEVTTGITLYIALIFAVVSILTKGWMYIYTKKAAKKIKSEALAADAVHHLTDSISSIASLLGIIGLIIGKGFAIADPIASFIIAFFILKVAIDIGRKAISEVLDTSASEEFNNNIKKEIESFPEVKKINSLKTRLFANKIYVEVEIAVDDNLTVKEGHDIALKVHDSLEEKYEEIKHCMVHVDPASINPKE